MSNLIKIRPVGAEVFHADGRTDGHDEANRSFFVILQTYFNTCGSVPPDSGRFAARIVTIS